MAPLLDARRSGVARRRRPIARAAVLVGAMALAAGCSSVVGGVAAPPVGGVTGAGTSTAGSNSGSSSSATVPTGGQITVPSGGVASPTASGTAGSGSSAAQSGATPGTATSGTAPASTSSSGSPAAIPSGLEKFYTQQLQWGSCSQYVTGSADSQIYASSALQCGKLTVPLDYSQPTGPTVTLGVLRKQSSGGSQRIGSLVINPGGPGASGMSFAGQLAAGGELAQLNEYFDIVGFDPRGIGASAPTIKCHTDAEWDAERATDFRSDTAAHVAAANQILQKDAQNCLARSGGGGIDGKTFLEHVGTIDVARDMDVLRAVLGDKKLTYYGGSYGSRLGYIYAEQFPQNVRGMILDGIVSPTLDAGASLIQQQQGFEQTFQAFAAWCAQNDATCPLGTDASKFDERYQQLSRPLLTKPLAVNDGRKLSYTDANSGLTEALYYDAFWPTLDKALQALVAGNGNPLMALADQLMDRNADGTYTNEIDAFNAIRCMDSVPITDPAKITAINAQVIKVAPAQWNGDPAGAIADFCAFDPLKPTWTPHKLSIPSLPKVLIMSTKGDPATPYQNGVELAQQIPSFLLTAAGEHHGAFLQSDCADRIGNTYLETLQLPAAGTTC